MKHSGYLNASLEELRTNRGISKRDRQEELVQALKAKIEKVKKGGAA